jgi:hypothetical protein
MRRFLVGMRLLSKQYLMNVLLFQVRLNLVPIQFGAAAALSVDGYNLVSSSL